MRSSSYLLIVALMASACSGSSSTTDTATTPTSLLTPSIFFSGTEFLVPGQVSQVMATERLASGTTEDVTNTAAWTSSDPAVATVSSTGLVKAVAIGAATISAADSATVGTWVVSVNANTVTSLLVAGPSSIGSVQNGQMTAVASFRGGTTQTVTSAATWQSSNPGVAGVSSSGYLATVKPGTTTITATYMGVSGTWLLTVNDTVTSVLVFGPVSLASSTMQGIQFVAGAMMSTGPEQGVTNTATWSSSNSAVATVSATGFVTAVAPGTTDISATYGGVTGTVPLLVN